MSDRTILYATAFLRALATGMLGVLLGIYLAKLQFTPEQIGLTISAGLIGASLAIVLVTVAGDRFGRRRWLTGLALLGALGGLGAALASSIVAISVAAFAGMLNGMGKDRGAALALEQAILPATSTDEERTRAFAWYHVLQDVGHAVGGLLAATPEFLRNVAGMEQAASLRTGVGLYALLLLATAVLYLRLSPAMEIPADAPRNRITPESRRILFRLSALFALDSVAGGFFGSALLSFFFYQRFGATETAIALLFLGARTANALSHLGAAWLAERIGLVNTMVFTHIPSSVLLMTVAFAPDFPTAAILFLAREGLAEMDVPTRQSYVMAVVRPEERTFASGLTHIVRMGGWAVAPYFAGLLMQVVALSTPLFIGAGMKISYDLTLYFAFRQIKPPEEGRQ